VSGRFGLLGGTRIALSLFRMSATKASLRLRMSSHDAHYAGELVDGARMLALFGDLATELLIALDGDEGLFRAYDSVEFLAPVLAGDYIEATAELVAVGNTSRRMKFEARKVIHNLRSPGAPASAAEVLREPVVVCRATGTCVTPKVLQRGSSKNAFGVLGPVVLTAAIVGAEVTRAQTPHLPLSPAEIAQEAAHCVAAGAAVIHLHVRNPDGTPTQTEAAFRAAIAAIYAATDCIIQTSTGGAVGMSIAERAGPLGCKPPMATLNCGTTNFGSDIFVNSKPDIRELAAHLRAAGSVAELECYDLSHVEEALALYKENLIAAPLHFQFVLGIPGALGATEANLEALVARLPEHATWGVAAVGRHQLPMTELAIRRGGYARVGLEDNIYLEKGVLAEGSAPLVERAAAYARSIGRTVATVAQARDLLGVAAR
jgi:3-keto-5-aminohexanoate cleavage enzyme